MGGKTTKVTKSPETQHHQKETCPNLNKNINESYRSNSSFGQSVPSVRNVSQQNQDNPFFSWKHYEDLEFLDQARRYESSIPPARTFGNPNTERSKPRDVNSWKPEVFAYTQPPCINQQVGREQWNGQQQQQELQKQQQEQQQRLQKLQQQEEQELKKLQQQQKQELQKQQQELQKQQQQQHSTTFNWNESERLAVSAGIDLSVAENIIKLFDEKSTIPFIARYRRNLVGGLDADHLRRVKNCYDQQKILRQKSMKLLKKVSDQSLHLRIKQATSIDELQIIEENYVEKKKPSEISPANQQELKDFASQLLYGVTAVETVSRFVNSGIKELKNSQAVKIYLKHIIADIMKKNEDLQGLLNTIKTSDSIRMESKLKKEGRDEFKKYQVYYDFSKPVNNVSSYQVLAINRGEDQGVLSVKIVIPNYLWDPVRKHYKTKFLSKGVSFLLRNEMFDEALKSITDSAKSMLERQIRRKLTADAVEESMSVFTSNLRHLLLTKPLKGKVVLAIDPGFRAGCKVAIIDDKGKPLHFTKFFLNQKNEACYSAAKRKMKKLVQDFKCDIIAIGDGNGGLETVEFVSNFLKSLHFLNHEVTYTLVDEQGISVYSCSEAAKEEFPDLDPLYISAVSLGRKLQDPISELVKVDPKNLGVGQYQHDLPQEKLDSALTEVTVECVSFVGVDVNTASYHLLRRVAGLNSDTARNIRQWLHDNCHFRSREDLRRVKGIGDHTFKQCAGFLRISPLTASCSRPYCKNRPLNPLDETWIHPELYDTTYRLLALFDIRLNLGNDQFIERVEKNAKAYGLDKLSMLLNVPKDNLQLIIEALVRLPGWDCRSSSEYAPKVALKSVSNLKIGDIVSGTVKNVVEFGSFVDIGIAFNGLVHKNYQNGKNLKVNDVIEVRILGIDEERKRIELAMADLNQKANLKRTKARKQKH